MEPILTIEDLHMSLEVERQTVTAVDGVNLTFRRGKIVGVVGESGSRKSVTAPSILRLLPRSARIDQGRIQLYRDEGAIDLTKLHPDRQQISQIRGNDIAIIFQEPMAAFSPVHTIGNQMVEAIRLHRDLSRKAARLMAIDLLAKVGIGNPKQRIHQYAFELSGGMRQRAMIATALAGNPRLLTADEPTTAHDVTIQAQVLQLIKEIQAGTGLAVMFITHDLGVVAQLADEVAVMYLSKVVEHGSVLDIFQNPKHPYTVNLLQSIA